MLKEQDIVDIFNKTKEEYKKEMLSNTKKMVPKTDIHKNVMFVLETILNCGE